MPTYRLDLVNGTSMMIEDRRDHATLAELLARTGHLETNRITNTSAGIEQISVSASQVALVAMAGRQSPLLRREEGEGQSIKAGDTAKDAGAFQFGPFSFMGPD